ncbi:acyl-CoA dehydrogenase family protein [Prescottella agglutinans]|uniref:Alkylation response protein AidB-like acyl-CoA dehydrogenase n=1 Tax=Prescottella agglutinans TaxID=1644129 RepID=A0ABT6M9F2_9NOCA|nr:acyl-CoA dehydrogenase family protein [Prescottella agglutinans]MDH6280938.1 alkylation response protein AidB-like acyl-CoA dehydrogenase [Prescottella agglutinans]
MTTEAAQYVPLPDLLYDATHDQLRESLRSMLAQHCTTERLLHAVDAGELVDLSLWGSITQMGLTGLLIPTEFGGEGATTREAAVVMEELGRAVAPVPYLASAVLAAVTLVECARFGSAAASSALATIATGTSIATLAVESTRAPRSTFPAAVHAVDAGPDATRLTGTVTSVLAADCADAFVVPARLAGEPVLALVGSRDPGVRITPVTSMDTTRPVASIEFDSAPATLLAAGAIAVDAVDSALRTGSAMLAAEQVGVLEWALDTACSYLNVRHQFGRPIGSYQALRNRAAEMWIALGQARATSQYAAAVLAAGGDDADVASSLAKAHCTHHSLHAIEDCLQMHGGVGFTWEHPIHLRLKRAFAAQLTLGTADHHRVLLGELLDIPAPDGFPRYAASESGR